MNKNLTLAFVGDISLSFWRGRFDNSASLDQQWKTLAEAMGQYDLLVGNMECCLVDSSCSYRDRKQPMALPAVNARFFSEAGFSALSLANNHMLDCGRAGLEVTRKSIESWGVKVFGAGRDSGEAEEICFMERAGRRIALLSACDFSPYHAKRKRAGVAPMDKRGLKRRVKSALRDADLVVVILHADLEFSRVPARWRQRLSRWLIDQGAHLVIQHHPHVLQGVEEYRDGLIAYSLGNFVFPLHGNKYQGHRAGVFDTVVFLVDVDFEREVPRLSYRIEPGRIAQDHFPYVLDEEERKAAIQEFEALSCLIGNSGRHRRLWLQRCRKEFRSRFWNLYYALARKQIRTSWALAWRLVTRPEDRRWLVGLLSLGYL